MLIKSNVVKEKQISLTIERTKIFLITFFSYACVHLTRTTWSNAKPYFQKETNCEDWFLGFCDFLFMFFYSVGLMVFGRLGDQMDLKNFILMGMIGIAIFQFMIGIVGLTLHDKPEALLPFIAFLMPLRGFFEFSCWPGCVSSMGNWFGKENRGFMMSLWVGCKNFGDMSGFLLVGSLILHHFRWRWPFCFIAVSFLQLSCILLIYKKLEPYPEKLGFQINKSIKPIPEQGESQAQSPLTFKQALKIQGFKIYLLIFLCLKSTQYGMLFWLPIYLHNKDDESGTPNGKLSYHSPLISTMFPIGSWFGGTIQGIISDKIQKRALVMCPMLLMCAFLMFIVNFKLGNEPGPYYLTIFLIGICLGGPYNNVSSVLTADLASKSQTPGKKSVLASISAFLESFAVIGASLFQILLSFFYEISFYLFTINCFITFILLYPIAQKEIKEMDLEEKEKENSNQIQQQLQNNLNQEKQNLENPNE